MLVSVFSEVLGMCNENASQVFEKIRQTYMVTVVESRK